jgi:hypothetical protein
VNIHHSVGACAVVALVRLSYHLLSLACSRQVIQKWVVHRRILIQIR